jgi:hypothetical protein
VQNTYDTHLRGMEAILITMQKKNQIQYLSVLIQETERITSGNKDNPECKIVTLILTKKSPLKTKTPK